MQHNNKSQEHPQKEAVKEQHTPLPRKFTNEVVMLINQNPPADGDEPDDEDNELGDDDIGTDGIEEEDNRSERVSPQEDLDNNEDERPDSDDVEESDPIHKETDIDQSEQAESNSGSQSDEVNATGSEQGNVESSRKRRPTNENSQRINGDDPEISETEKEIPETEEPAEEPEQPGVIPEEKEISNDANIRDLYDTNPNASTIRSSNADRTFGDEKQQSDGEKGDPDRMEGENES